METLLKLEQLNTTFDSRTGTVHPVCDVNLELHRGEILGLIGETGCGKTVFGMSILRLLPKNATVTGKVLFDGRDLLQLSEKEMRRIRGKRIAFIGQNPSEALNPVLKNGTQLMESIRLATMLPGKEARARSGNLLGKLGFVNPDAVMRSYPLELSGGMKQRVLAAMAMSGKPDILIADEPTKGLDSLIRGQVIAMLRRFIRETGCAAIIITHDLKFADVLCDRIAVMYAGELVEAGSKGAVFERPASPYMKALIASQPQNGLHPIPGSVCSLIDLPKGCRFCSRCTERDSACGDGHPEMKEIENGHFARCGKL